MVCACRARVWLFLSYIVSFASIVAAVWVMIAHYCECLGCALLCAALVLT